MLKKILLTLLILVVLLLGIGFLLPVDPDVERSIVIDAPASAIYPAVATLRTWPDWTAWSRERDPSCEWSFEGPETGAGAVMRWRGRSHMQGTVTIDEADPASGIRYTLQMEDMEPMRGSIALDAEGDGTRVTWRFHGELDGMPWSNWLHMALIDPMVGAAFETGLEKLKARAESGAEAGAEAASHADTRKAVEADARKAGEKK